MVAEKKSSLEEIRRRAEGMAQKKPLLMPTTEASQYQAVLHELHVHQIELEIQNEELRAIHADLERSRSKYSDLFDHAPVGYLIIDRSGIILESNRTFATMVAREPGELVGKPFAEYLIDSDKAVLLGQFKSFFKNPENKRIDVRLSAPRGRKIHLAVYGRKPSSPHGSEPGKPAEDRVRIVCIDISRQVEAERALAEAHAALSLRHEIAEIMLLASDKEMFSSVLDCLCAHFTSRCGYFGYMDEQGNLLCPSRPRGFFPKCSAEEKPAVIPEADWRVLWGAGQAIHESVCRNSGVRLPDGQLSVSNVLAVPIVKQERLIGHIVMAESPGGYCPADKQRLESVARWIAPVLDARLQRDRQTARRIKAEGDLQQAQRMESIGVLAGGIAHDFNNILAPIIGYAEMMLDDMPENSPHRSDLQQISKAAHRARDLVGQLLAFSRKQMLQTRQLDLNACVQNLSGMFSRLLREDISVTYSLDRGAAPINADPGQIDQILLNLIANAQDAMPEGGTLNFETGSMTVSTPLQVQDFTIPPGTYTRLSVQDSGDGIPEDVRPYIFEPFFTTKDMGQGTGMGLATCYGIVKQHGGYIWVESEPGAGTCFSILLPADEAPPAVAPEAPTPDREVRRSRGETIMVVEDEPAVRKMAVLALQRIGYHVIETDSPQACLERVERLGIDFDLLLSDLIMPGCNGKELYRQMRAVKPDLKVIFMSGYTDDVISGKGVNDEGGGFIAKPFTLRDLAHTVRTVLDSETPADGKTTLPPPQ